MYFYFLKSGIDHNLFGGKLTNTYDITLEGFNIATAADRDGLLEVVDDEVTGVWPEFMLHDTVANQYWARLYSEFPEYQFALFDKGSDKMAAAGNCIPLYWDEDPENLPDEGWDWSVRTGFSNKFEKVEPNALSALSIAVSHEYRGRKLSGCMVEIMKETGRRNGLGTLLAPVRPSLKPEYPLIPMEKYMKWKNAAGLPFDPWLRVHVRDGGRIAGICGSSMTIPGSVKNWENWTGMKFPGSDRYIVEGALVPVEINTDLETGIYIEPNVWVVHKIQ